jgi:predicted dithiol-disulfide oxidoreductase (DUF899 family)
MSFPEVVSRDQWLEARLRLLAEEKKETRRRDALNAQRRSLPMVRIEKEYVFEGLEGPTTLPGLFGDSSQLIIQHIMFGPDWDAACPSCTNFIEELSDGLLAHLRARATALALVSRAPLTKIEAYGTQRGWSIPGTPPTAAISITTFTSRLISPFRRSSTTTVQHRTCSAVSGPASSPVPAVSCVCGTRSSTPIRLTDAATSTSPASIRCSI